MAGGGCGRPGAIPPYWHPTTVVAVDDDPLLLESLAFHLSRAQRCEAYVSPVQALAAILERGRSARPDGWVQPLTVSDLNELPGDPSDHGVRLHLRSIADIMANPRRASEISVLVVDYDMPQMDGLALCRAISHLPIQKILLTGKADERLAVDAFNEGIIDRFILKHDPDVRGRLKAEIALADERYFRGITRFLADIFHANHDFPADPDFAGWFAAERQRDGIVEYYFSVDPPGMICFDARGRGRLLLVQDREQIEAHRADAWHQHAPAHVLDGMGREDRQPWFAEWGEGRDNLPRWAIHPASRVGQGKRFWCSWLDLPASLQERIRPALEGDRFRRYGA